FAGLDMEFTGLHSSLLDRQLSLFDSPAERYRKARQNVQKFAVSQLGLSIFCHETSNTYVAHSYNFFLFPTTFGQRDSEFSFQASSIQFLSHYGFDYNKFLKEGIPYMNETQEKRFEHLLRDSSMVHSGFGKDKLKKIIEEVTCWVSSAEEKDSLILHDLYDFQMFEIQLILRHAIKNIWTIPLEGHEPLVGHNMLMDLLHLHEKFYSPLPGNVISSVNNTGAINTTNQSCPEIFHSSDCIRYGMSGYGSQTLDIWSKISTSKAMVTFCIFYFVQNLSATKECPHEAAYDAFLCGSVLLKVAHLILCNISCDQTRTVQSFPQYLDVLSPYVNQVNLIRGGVQKINFSGMDDCTKHLPLLIANVHGWPGVNEEQIHQELRIFCKFDVRWLRMNQFLLLSNRFRDVRVVLEEYKNHPNLQISLYHHWRHSPQVNCFLKICGIVASWSLLAFLLGGSSNYVV
ncbi:hypothetical protein JD844_024721, partial [Phrynosoma platyrhinos]